MVTIATWRQPCTHTRSCCRSNEGKDCHCSIPREKHSDFGFGFGLKKILILEGMCL